MRNVGKLFKSCVETIQNAIEGAHSQTTRQIKDPNGQSLGHPYRLKSAFDGSLFLVVEDPAFMNAAQYASTHNLCYPFESVTYIHRYTPEEAAGKIHEFDAGLKLNRLLLGVRVTSKRLEDLILSELNNNFENLPKRQQQASQRSPAPHA